MRGRVPIVVKLLAAYLVPAALLFAGFGWIAHFVAKRALEEELGRRLQAVAAAAATVLDSESLALLAPGDEETRTYRNLKRRLDELNSAAELARLYVFDAAGTSRCDTRNGVPIGQRYYALDADRAELRAVLAGHTASSVLFTGAGGRVYKSGFAPIVGASGKVEMIVGVEGAAAMYEQLAGLRRTLAVVGGCSALAVVALSLLMGRFLTRPIRLLARAATRIGHGDLEAPIARTSRDEIGLLADTLEAMRVQLRARDERMQMMLAGIAHEVRNPLAGMELYAGLLRDELPAGTDGGDQVRRIEREIDRLKTIVAEFLDYARRPKLDLAPQDIGALLGEVRDLALPAALERGVTVELDLPAPARTQARCDSGQLRRALLNLAHNGVQACASGGKLVLGARRDGSDLLITVADDGAGMAPDVLAKIWTPFYTTRQRGTGLGLAFVRDIVRDHGARIDVESTPGKGTTFTLALPA